MFQQAGRLWKYEPLASGEKFHNHRGHTFKGFSGPVGSGKSYAFGYESLFLASFNRGLMGLIGAPTYRILRDATKQTFLEILEIEQVRYRSHKSENRITLLDWKSEIIFRSLDDYEHLRGPNLAWFGVDELTYCKPEAWSRLEARLRHPQASRLCGFAAWTPKGYDAVYERFVEKPGPDFWAVLASPRENIYTDRTGLYDRLAASYDEKLYRQEVLGEYLNVHSGQVYYAFDRQRNVRPVSFDPKGGPLIWSLDFNIDPMCSVICQAVDNTSRLDLMSGRKTSIVNVLDVLYLPNTSTPEACVAFGKRAAKYFHGAPGNVLVYGDATGKKRQSASAGANSDWAAVREYFALNREFKPFFKHGTANPQVRDRVAAVNGMLRNALAETSLFVDPSCDKLIRDFERVTWKQGTSELDQDKDPGLTHLTDALGYYLEKEFGAQLNGGPRATRIN
jgi:hypothetical protein